MTEQVLLSVKELRRDFPLSREVTIHAVDGISFQIHRGEVYGLVGESGCGKSTAARSILGLDPLTGGQVRFGDWLISDPSVRRAHRAELGQAMQLIFQDSAAALNPRMRVESIIAEPLTAGRRFQPVPKARIAELMEQVGLEASLAGKRPGELSGGQRQRVAIARAIAPRPALIVADEPVASLDVSIQAQILTLFRHLQQEHGFAFLFIAHDLSVVRSLCDTVGVMLRGRLVETAPTEELFTAPLHPYTRALLSAMPVPDPRVERSRHPLFYDPGELPPSGTLFEARPGHWVLSDS